MASSGGAPKSEYLYGTIELVPALLRTAAGGGPGYATHKAARLGSGGSFKLEIDDTPVPPGDYLEVRFENFKKHPERKGNADLLYWLDTTSETPILLLNEAVDDFKEAMLAPGGRGRNIRVRNATYDTIVSRCGLRWSPAL